MAHDALVCQKCGNLRSVCSDPSVDWHPRTEVCWPTASVEWGRRLLRERHKSDKDDPSALHYLDGRWVWVSQIAPDVSDDEFI